MENIIYIDGTIVYIIYSCNYVYLHNTSVVNSRQHSALISFNLIRKISLRSKYGPGLNRAMLVGG